MGQNLILYIGDGWTKFQKEGSEALRNILIFNKNNPTCFEINFIQRDKENLL